MIQFYPESGDVQYGVSCTCGYSERTKPAHESGAKLRAKLAVREHLLGRTGHKIRLDRCGTETDQEATDEP